MKILIIGHARHGKDTVSEILSQQEGLSFTSSSEFCAKNVVFEILKNQYNYTTWQECFEDRANHRAEWYQIISSYNDVSNSRLAREIFEKYDIYCGLRKYEELEAVKAQRLCDLIIWVDASERVSLEPESSMTVRKEQADVILDNNSSYEDLVIRCKDFPWGRKVSSGDQDS